MDDVIFNAEEAADFLRISKITLYQLNQQKKVPAHYIGHKLTFIKSELYTWVKTNQSSEVR